MEAIIRKQKIITLVGISVFCVAVLALWWCSRIVKHRSEQILVARQELASYELYGIGTGNEATTLTALTTQLEVLESYRVTSDEIPALLSSLEAMAQYDGVVFAILGVQTPGTNTNQKLTIDFSAQGSSSAIEPFLAHLSQQSYQVKFTKFSVSVTDDQQWKVLASIEIVSF